MRLNQIVAVVPGKKTRAQKALTNVHRGLSEQAITGLERVYKPKEDDGDQLPPESTRIHVNVPEEIAKARDVLAEFYDVVLTQELGNTSAMGDVVVEGAMVLEGMSVTMLLFLEKRLVDLHTFVAGLPVLPPDRAWTFDDNRNCYVTEPVKTLRTKKLPKPIVKYDATPEHPAQTEIFAEDVTVGEWETTHLSSAVPSNYRANVLRRIEELQDATKRAREDANSTEVGRVKLGEKILAHVFGSLDPTEGPENPE